VSDGKTCDAKLKEGESVCGRHKPKT
jgi:hypothetical protein